ncbi:MAG: hypothetical protein HC782_01815 [Gammaproteobacteria bacterium]|nr:hypothetical protein [Gammaproteobacteria bacterium]
MVDRYFEVPADFEASLALAEFLSQPESPLPLDEITAMAVMEQLTQPPVVPEELLADLAESEKPAEALVGRHVTYIKRRC